MTLPLTFFFAEFLHKLSTAVRNTRMTYRTLCFKQCGHRAYKYMYELLGKKKVQLWVNNNFFLQQSGNAILAVLIHCLRSCKMKAQDTCAPSPPSTDEVKIKWSITAETATTGWDGSGNSDIFKSPREIYSAKMNYHCWRPTVNSTESCGGVTSGMTLIPNSASKGERIPCSRMKRHSTLPLIMCCCCCSLGGRDGGCWE